MGERKHGKSRTIPETEDKTEIEDQRVKKRWAEIFRENT
jgi:hypothetical protein